MTRILTFLFDSSCSCLMSDNTLKQEKNKRHMHFNRRIIIVIKKNYTQVQKDKLIPSEIVKRSWHSELTCSILRKNSDSPITFNKRKDQPSEISGFLRDCLFRVVGPRFSWFIGRPKSVLLHRTFRTWHVLAGSLSEWGD